jgi:PAS domain S-box-containing protein
VGGRTLRPLTALTQAAQAIAKGEWREVPEAQRNDEVGVLAQSFTLMTARLKETLNGLRRSEARLEEAQRLTHVGYWERDFDTDHIAWSDETFRIFGLAPQQPGITFAELQELIHPEDRRMVTQAVAEALRGGPRYDVEYRVVRPNGELRIVHSQGDVTRDESGQPHRMFGTIQDITERKQEAEALRAAQAELAHVNRVATVGQLTGSIAHEVAQPIAAALADAQAALRWLGARPPDLEEVRQALDHIVKCGNRAGEVIGRIRALIKKAPARKRRFDLNEAILDVIDLTRSEVLRHGVLQQTQLATGLPLIEGDRIQLQQVILNLIMNAVEAMSGIGEEARELLISTEMEPTGGVLVTVRDSGPGLDPTSVDRVFEAFYTTKPEGIGIGLAICRSIIEAHGGRMWVTANAPRGAVFRFTLPLRRDEPALAEHVGEMPVA